MMENLESILIESVNKALNDLYQAEVNDKQIQIQNTRKEFSGDKTVVVFPFLRFSKKSPEQTAKEIGDYLRENVAEISDYNVIKGFLNISFSTSYWLSVFYAAFAKEKYGIVPQQSNAKTVMVEYSSPNTNKPLHLGHIRNIILGYSISEIAKANGYNVVKTNIVNDRGIHICKSMLAWMKWGEGETPESSGLKGDHLVGKYYVIFDQQYKKEIQELVDKGEKPEIAKKTAPILLEAQEMLRKWESGDEETVALWEKMNSWVYAGFDVTYNTLGVNFDKIYYESNTYKLGRSIVLDGLAQNILYQREDKSVWADLTKDKLDEKILLRSDGTSVYMTQDIGTAHQRHEEYKFDSHIYVVGNEQDYHFKVLNLILNKLGFDWADSLYHLSYGMVELPEGKMKSREGTVVDADDLIEEMVSTARQVSTELGKLDGYEPEEVEQVVKTIALGALKYFILKVDPKKTMLFNPKESIDFNGNTGPFIQYTYARIQSLIRKGADKNIEISTFKSTNLPLDSKEVTLLKEVSKYPDIISEAWQGHSPALIANYVFNLAKEYNQFYHDFPVLKEKNAELLKFRLQVSKLIGQIIESGMSLMGIHVPERM